MPDSEDLQETVEHYSKGGEGVNHEQFQVMDLLESDEATSFKSL